MSNSVSEENKLNNHEVKDDDDVESLNDHKEKVSIEQEKNEQKLSHSSESSSSHSSSSHSSDSLDTKDPIVHNYTDIHDFKSEDQSDQVLIEKAKEAFMKYDIDHDGFLTKGEIDDIVSQFAEFYVTIKQKEHENDSSVEVPEYD